MAYSYLVGDPVGSEYVTLDDARLGGSGDVGDVGEDGIAIVGAPIAGKESDKPLWRVKNSSVPALVVSIGHTVICSLLKLGHVRAEGTRIVADIPRMTSCSRAVKNCFVGQRATPRSMALIVILDESKLQTLNEQGSALIVDRIAIQSPSSVRCRCLRSPHCGQAGGPKLRFRKDSLRFAPAFLRCM